MSMQNKPQMVEAVMFFNEQRGICKQMFFPEFEALLDGVVNMPEFADEQMRMAYLLINPRLLIRAVLFFYLDFDEKGAADKGWNLPLRHLADNAGRGPDLGAEVRLVLPGHPEGERDVLRHRHVREQRQLLEHHGGRPVRGRNARHVLPAPPQSHHRRRESRRRRHG